MAQYARQTAIPCTLGDISSGPWVQNEGILPSGVQTQRGFVSRASIMGVVIDKSATSFSLDDGTNVVSVRSFDTKPVLASVGDIVLVIGRPREYNGERYLVLEICKRLRNTAWVQYRKRELDTLRSASFEIPTVEPVVTEDASKKNPYDVLMAKIRELDAGGGVAIGDLLTVVPEAEKFIRTLIEEGEIFEIKPGRVKILE
jgi:exosome complex RNA-binding protein Csl4